VNAFFDFGQPFYLLTFVLAVVNLILLIVSIFKLSTYKDFNRIKGIDRCINSILLVCFFMLFFVSFEPIYQLILAYSSIALSGTGDPKVIIGGLIAVLIPANIVLLACSFFLISWFFLRVYQRRLLESITPK